MRIVKIDDLGNVYCGQFEAAMMQCDVLGLALTDSQCGDCPLIQMHHRIVDIFFQGAINAMGKPKSSTGKQTPAGDSDLQ